MGLAVRGCQGVGAGDGVGPFVRIFNLNFSSPSKHSTVGANCDLDVEPVSYLK